MRTVTIHVSLPPELARFVRSKVQSGAYSSASEVVREALRRLAKQEQGVMAESDPFDRKEVRKALEGLKRLSAGQTLGPGLSIRGLISAR